MPGGRKSKQNSLLLINMAYNNTGKTTCTRPITRKLDFVVDGVSWAASISHLLSLIGGHLTLSHGQAIAGSSGQQKPFLINQNLIIREFDSYWGGRNGTGTVRNANLPKFLPLQGSFFTKNSSKAIHPPPTRTMTVLRRIRTSRNCCESPNYGRSSKGGNVLMHADTAVKNNTWALLQKRSASGQAGKVNHRDYLRQQQTPFNVLLKENLFIY